MRKVLFFFLFFSFSARAQQLETDSAVTLQNVSIRAYESNRKLIEIPAAISILTNRDLNRYDNSNIVDAINVLPGVRMDERSPGSYRLNIRGSSLRSPFGVRNVKIYYDGIPFTDPGGSTYLNQLGFYNIQSAEVIKGPAGSMYGAGTGGVILFSSDAVPYTPGVSIDYTAGSFHLNNININLKTGKKNVRNEIGYQRQSSDGYRDHTGLKRDVFSWNSSIRAGEKTSLKSHFIYGDLYYQTPGALTLAEYQKNPRSARPAAGVSPSADEAQAAFHAKTVLAGITLSQEINTNWANTTTAYAAYSQNRNPNFRNYSRTSEPHFGGRTVFQYAGKWKEQSFRVNIGAEFQKGFYGQRVYENNAGQPAMLQTDDEIYNTTGFAFATLEASFHDQWTISAGASINASKLEFTRLSNPSPEHEIRNFKNEIAPRFSLLKKINKTLSVYANIAGGFAAPTTAELLPSTDVFNRKLQAETGINYEAGLRGSLANNKLYIDLNGFYYRLKNAIVQLRDNTGGDYFINSGGANQQGLESYLSYNLAGKPGRWLDAASMYLSNTLFHFKYRDYQRDDKNFSGNKLPGVAGFTMASGIDLRTKPGFFANITFFHSSKIALNDANDAYARPYSITGIKAGYLAKSRKGHSFRIFAGVQNLFDETYSLGNDINAFGGRYYNSAAGRNYYAGIAFHFKS